MNAWKIFTVSSFRESYLRHHPPANGTSLFKPELATGISVTSPSAVIAKQSFGSMCAR